MISPLAKSLSWKQARHFLKRMCFTLLEVMLGIALFALTTGVVSWNVYHAVKKHRFRADVSTLKMQLQLGHRLALNTGVDWTFQLSQDQGRLRLSVLSFHTSAPAPKPVFINPLQVMFNGQEIEQLVIYFSSTGCIEPKGQLELRSSGFCQEISFPEYFSKQQMPDREGPSHPDDVEAS